MATKGKGATKKENNNPDVEYTPEELREELASYSKKMEENFAEIIEAKEKIEKLKKTAGLQDVNESDIKYYVDNEDSKKAKLAQEIVECIKVKANAQRRNTTIKKKLGEFIEELYNDIIKKLDELEKEHKQLTEKEQRGEELTKEEKARMREIKREAKILREEALYLKKEMDKAKKRADALIGDNDKPKKKEASKDKDKKKDEEAQQQQQGTQVVSGGGATPQNNDKKEQKEGGKATALAKKEEKDPKKERYLKLKDICARMSMPEDVLAALKKEKVTDEEIKELDEEFEKIYKAMLEDPKNVDRWDKRILLSMLCKGRYYEGAKPEERADYHIKTHVKGGKWFPQHKKKFPKDITNHMKVLDELKDFVINNDEVIYEELPKFEANDVRKRLEFVIANWNRRMGKYELAKVKQVKIKESSEAIEGLEDSVYPPEDIVVEVPSETTEPTKEEEEIESPTAPGE